jgi:hypothetical protein
LEGPCAVSCTDPGPEDECVAVVWTSLGPLPRWVPGPTTRWAPGLLGLGHTAPDGVGRKDYSGEVLG